MTHNEILTFLQSTGLPVAYDHFAEGESPDPPFLCFLFPASDNFSADGRVYQRIDSLHIELYTDRKQPETEALVEAVLEENELFYEKTEVWIPEEKLYEVLYITEVLKTDENEEQQEETEHE